MSMSNEDAILRELVKSVKDHSKDMNVLYEYILQKTDSFIGSIVSDQKERSIICKKVCARLIDVYDSIAESADIQNMVYILTTLYLWKHKIVEKDEFIYHMGSQEEEITEEDLLYQENKDFNFYIEHTNQMMVKDSSDLTILEYLNPGQILLYQFFYFEKLRISRIVKIADNIDEEMLLNEIGVIKESILDYLSQVGQVFSDQIELEDEAEEEYELELDDDSDDSSEDDLEDDSDYDSHDDLEEDSDRDLENEDEYDNGASEDESAFNLKKLQHILALAVPSVGVLIFAIILIFQYHSYQNTSKQNENSSGNGVTQQQTEVQSTDQQTEEQSTVEETTDQQIESETDTQETTTNRTNRNDTTSQAEQNSQTSDRVEEADQSDVNQEAGNAGQAGDDQNASDDVPSNQPSDSTDGEESDTSDNGAGSGDNTDSSGDSTGSGGGGQTTDGPESGGSSGNTTESTTESVTDGATSGDSATEENSSEAATPESQVQDSGIQNTEQ